jgi:hypothetical protein
MITDESLLTNRTMIHTPSGGSFVSLPMINSPHQRQLSDFSSKTSSYSNLTCERKASSEESSSVIDNSRSRHEICVIESHDTDDIDAVDLSSHFLPSIKLEPLQRRTSLNYKILQQLYPVEILKDDMVQNNLVQKSLSTKDSISSPQQNLKRHVALGRVHNKPLSAPNFQAAVSEVIGQTFLGWNLSTIAEPIDSLHSTSTTNLPLDTKINLKPKNGKNPSLSRNSSSGSNVSGRRVKL